MDAHVQFCPCTFLIKLYDTVYDITSVFAFRVQKSKIDFYKKKKIIKKTVKVKFLINLSSKIHFMALKVYWTEKNITYKKRII